MTRVLALVLFATCTVGPTTNDGASPSAPDTARPGEQPSTAPPGVSQQPNGIGGARACNTDADCSDGVCEGEGCGDMQGRCSPKAGRMCTRDHQSYCGCDGQTFHASGSCPGKRFAARGECKSALPDGSKCTTAQQCASGICEGEGCGDDQPGTCMSKQRQCTMDLRQYCGCDGKTHQGSGSCPSLRYSKRGAC